MLLVAAAADLNRWLMSPNYTPTTSLAGGLVMAAARMIWPTTTPTKRTITATKGWRTSTLTGWGKSNITGWGESLTPQIVSL